MGERARISRAVRDRARHARPRLDAHDPDRLEVAGFLGALVATLALYVPCSMLCFGVAHTWKRYRGTKWHSAIENGLRPIGAGLMIAGGVMILRIEASGWLGWAVPSLWSV